MDKKEKKSLPEPRTYTVEQIAAMLNIVRNLCTAGRGSVTLPDSHIRMGTQ